MKIRIRSNTVRLRLTKPEVENFCKKGFLEERSEFVPEPFIYAIKTDASIDEMKMNFHGGRFELLVPRSWIDGWNNSNKVGFESNMQTENGSHLTLLLEKDFKCLDQTTEDQSDQYENPLKINS